MKASILYSLAWLLGAAAQGFSALIVGVEDFVPNDSGAQSRIAVSLVLLDPLNDDFDGESAVVDHTYAFSFPSIKDGIYQLLVHSHDLVLSQNRWRLSVDDGLQTIMSYDEPYDRAKYNASSATRISLSAPLVIQCLGIVQHKQYMSRTLSGMIMKSPLGFILRSKIYSTMFAICLVIILLPIIIPYINPDIVETLDDLQANAKLMSPLAEKEVSPGAAIQGVDLASKITKLNVRRRN